MNHKCYESETWHDCVPPWDLLFDKWFGRDTKGLGGRGRKTFEKIPKNGFFGSIFRIFKIISKTVTYVILCIALHGWWKFGTNPTWFGPVMSQKPPKISPKCPFFLLWENLKIYNLRTTNAMKMKLTRIVYLHDTFHLTKNLGVAQRGSGGVDGKPLKETPKMGFLDPFLGSFKNLSKTVAYVILCFTQHRWWKFCPNRTRCEDVAHEKPPKNSPKCPFLLVRETLEIYNLRTTNVMKMKLAKIVYLHDTFHLTKDLGVTLRVWQGVAGKPLKTSHKMSCFAQFWQFLYNWTKTVTYIMHYFALCQW